MSTFGWSNITGIDDFTSTGGSGLPGGINGSIQYNDLGTDFAGVSNFLYNDNTSTMSVVNVDCTDLTASGDITSVNVNCTDLTATNSVSANTITATTTMGCATLNATTINATNISAATVSTTGSIFSQTNITATNRVNANQVVSTSCNIATATLNTIVNTNSVSFGGTVRDSANSAGTNGQVLYSTGTATVWGSLPSIYPSRVFASNVGAYAVGVNATVTMIIDTVHFANGFTYLPPPTLFIEVSNAGRYVIDVGVTIFGSGPGDTTAVLKNIGTIATVAQTFTKTHTVPHNHYAHLSDVVVFDFNAGDQYGVQLTSLNAACQYSALTFNISRVG